ncbi:MAG: hypothetical protein Q7R93_01850 [bacterium]|nr:hypothetical protein [bacterium]
MLRAYTTRVRIGFTHRGLLHGRAFRGTTTLFREETLVLERTISGKNRRHAVTVALNWLWKHFGHDLGQAQTLVTVDDPHEEVKYGTFFRCRAREYCYLDDKTISRLLAEAQGELVRETRMRSPHHPYGSVRRIKRRRKLLFRVEPCIYTDANNTFFYRYTHVPQHSKRGRFIRYRKVRFKRLEAHDLPSAKKEVERRNLLALHKSRRVLPGVRSLILLEKMSADRGQPLARVA